MASSRNEIDWDRLKPRILRDLTDGKTQNQIRQGLAGDPDEAERVSISKSQLETQLKHWRYRQGLHEPEWKVISHRINKRRKEGKPFSQVLVNGFIFNEIKVAKAINRYDTPTLVNRLPSPQIPPELSHHLIEVRTPPSNHRSLPPQLSRNTRTQATQESLALHLNSVRCIWPRTAQWSKLELSIGRFVDHFFLPKYGREEWFHDSFNLVGRNAFVSRTNQDENVSAAFLTGESLLPDQAWGILGRPHDGVSVHRDRSLRSFGGSCIHTAVRETLLGLLYGLSNHSLDENGHNTLESILGTPAFDTVLPHLKDVLTMVDSKMVQAIAEGLLKESIDTRNYSMLDLALDLGANTTQRMKYSVGNHALVILYTPLIALCDERTRRRTKGSKPGPEKLILSLLRRDPDVPDSTLLWLIRASCHAIAEEIIRNQPERVVNFAIAASDLGEDPWLRFNTYDPVSPLLVACSDLRQSVEKLSLIRCLLERNAKADLEAMIAAAGACDGKAIALLRQHGAPVSGFIPHLGSPLTSACRPSLYQRHHYYTDLSAVHVLLSLGASPDSLEDRGFNDWESSPLHILALAEERPMMTETLDFLLKRGADINRRARLNKNRGFRGAYAGVHIGLYGHLAETALEYAINRCNWMTATQLLSADCELTGREILFVEASTYDEIPKEIAQERFRKFIDTLLTKAPTQAAALHWSGFKVLPRAIQNEHEDMILALFRAGIEPTSQDLLHMLCNRKDARARVSPLSCDIQMKLVVAARRFETMITDISVIRMILAVACPEAVRYVLDSFPLTYDSEGLCSMIARVVSQDDTQWFPVEILEGFEFEQRESSLTLDLDDLREFISRRTILNRHEVWESTAVMMAARAGRPDILRILTGSFGHEFQNSGGIPLFLIKELLTCDPPTYLDIDEQNWDCLGVWIKYCRMDNQAMRCSPLTAAASVVPAEAAEEIVDLLLALNYQPDGWTILIASSQGRLSILERLKRLECWPYILNHKDRPEWCPTALQLAVYRNNIDIAKFLCNEGVMTNSIDLSPCRPFFSARPFQRSMNASDYIRVLPRTALQHAVEKGNMGLVTRLVDVGADVNAPAAMNSGATALQIACIQGSIPMVEYLISRGADPHAAGAAKHGRTALQGAAEHGRKDIVELLLAHSSPTSDWHREQLFDAFVYAQKNTHHVVASILHERLLPQWGLEGEETLQMPQEDWESSSEHSEFNEWRAEIEAWEKTFEDLPDFLRAYGGNQNLDVGGVELQIEQPAALQEDDSRFPRAIEWSIEGYSGFGVHWNSEINAYGGDVASGLTLQDDITAWVEDQPTLEGYDVDDMLPGGDFSFDITAWVEDQPTLEGYDVDDMLPGGDFSFDSFI